MNLSEERTGDAVVRAEAEHRRRWGPPAVVARAPGRVNLIGEHTDYNDGFVLPMAIPADTGVAISATSGTGRSELWSEAFGSTAFDSAAIDSGDGDPIDVERWDAHVRGVDRLLRNEGLPIPSWRATVSTDIPIGASVSSSAALEVAVASGLLRLAGVSWTPAAIAQLCQRVENDVLGLPSGIMDQLVSAAAEPGSALLIDCRSLATRPVALPHGAIVAVLDTGTRRKLTESAFAARRSTCIRAAELLGVDALRDASPDDLRTLAEKGAELEHRRARHVVTENQRTNEAATAMAKSDTSELGALMTASHLSLRDDYEVSGPELDAIVEAALAAPGCAGARMTGGGFAGCAVALVEADSVDAFRTVTVAGYAARVGADPARIWFCEPGPGASTSLIGT